jgi:hypothetical protein
MFVVSTDILCAPERKQIAQMGSVDIVMSLFWLMLLSLVSAGVSLESVSCSGSIPGIDDRRIPTSSTGKRSSLSALCIKKMRSI